MFPTKQQLDMYKLLVRPGGVRLTQLMDTDLAAEYRARTSEIRTELRDRFGLHYPNGIAKKEDGWVPCRVISRKKGSVDSHFEITPPPGADPRDPLGILGSDKSIGGDVVFWTEPGEQEGTKKVGVATAAICEGCGGFGQVNGFWIEGAADYDEAIAIARENYKAKKVDDRPPDVGYVEEIGTTCQVCAEKNKKRVDSGAGSTLECQKELF